MTGYGVAQDIYQIGRGKLEIGVEIRTVNSKFLDIHLRSPRPYVVFDAKIQELIRQTFKRGRVDLNLSVRMLDGADRQVQVNHAQVKALQAALMEVHQSLRLEPKVGISELLQFPEWLQTKEVDVNESEEWPHLAKVISAAASKVLVARQSEGKSLHTVLLKHRQTFGESYQQVKAANDTLMASVVQRARDRVKELFQGQTFDPQRLEQEVVLWAARSDFREELDRIEHHLETMDDLFRTTGEVGRKLEFVLQELHRETNTLGSKCPDAKTTPVVIEMKTCIERMREQIQNVE